MLRLSNAIAGLGAQLRDHAYYRGAMRMSRMARHVLSIEGSRKLSLVLNQQAPHGERKGKGTRVDPLMGCNPSHYCRALVC